MQLQSIYIILNVIETHVCVSQKRKFISFQSDLVKITAVQCGYFLSYPIISECMGHPVNYVYIRM